ncbi:hypothetical protein BkAM31D_12050 [Halalkalibacter krulwichiae]|uniref:Polymer-forming cytoskeletal n=1 Tax=Halalkalibacter krulwichiae TaxID=199441 RepID=A0A1X9MIR6_9BACI|nr:hypothetical protein BkAM31D_12050 [Halalkalibacter krulwichiae]
MKIISGNTKGDIVIEQDTLLLGNVEGNIRVLPGQNFS